MGLKVKQDDCEASAKDVEIHELTAVEGLLMSLASGAIAGACAKSSIAPLDRCKISFQINKEPYSTQAAIKYMKNVYTTEGFLALWRGNSATMMRILPYAAVQFSSHEQYRKLLGLNDTKSERNPKDVDVRRFIAGSLAGVTSQSLTYPLDVARARMAVTHNQEFSSLIRVFQKTFRKEGIKGFYRGYVPTVLGVIPYAGASFGTYETLKHCYNGHVFLEEHYSVVFIVDWRPDKKLGTLERLGFGAVSGICGQTVSYPLDIVRRRMQTAVITGHHYSSILHALTKIYREEGIIQGYFKGLSMNWIKGPIATGISFATYDLCKELITEAILHRR